MTAPDFEIVLPSDTALLSIGRDLARQVAEACGLSTAAADEVALAVDESATNVIEHAYHGQLGREYRIRFTTDASSLVIDVIDDGDSLDAEALPRVDLRRYASEGRKGGLGVHLMSKIMDSVTYLRHGRFNVCRLVRRLDNIESARR